VVEELLPATVALMAQVNMNERIVFWLDGFLDERHACLFRCSAAFFDIAIGAGTNDIFPDGLAAYAPRDNMVE